MPTPRFIRTLRRLTEADAERLKAQLQAQLAAAEDNARRHVERQTRAGLLFTREAHEAALEKLKWDMEKAADENARKIIEAWRGRVEEAHRRAERAEHEVAAKTVGLREASQKREAAEAAAEKAARIADEAERALEEAKRDADAWRLRALTAENELAATEGSLETARLAAEEAREDARAMLRRRHDHALRRGDRGLIHARTYVETKPEERL